MSGDETLPTPKVPIIVSAPNIKAFQVDAIPDTGATQTVISWQTAEQHRLKVKKTNITLYNASKQKMNLKGVTTVQISYGQRKITVRALVSGNLIDTELVISWHGMKNLGILPLNFPSPLSETSKAKVRSNKSARKYDELNKPIRILKNHLDEGGGQLPDKPKEKKIEETKTPINLHKKADDQNGQVETRGHDEEKARPRATLY